MGHDVRRRLIAVAVAGILGMPGGSAAGPQPASDGGRGMKLRGGEAGTAFQSLTVEGEDRVRFQFERPPLSLELDPAQAPGLDWGSAHDVLDRTPPDLVSPFVQGSSRYPMPYLGRPWLRAFAAGAVARFRPDVQNVERWKLEIADARGATVATFEGRGEPPREIAWDGRSTSGATATPDLTYSYVLNAYDRAGNKRSFVGSGFQVGPYRLDGRRGPSLVFSGSHLGSQPGALVGRGAAPSSPLLLEAASWLNQSPDLGARLRVQATARSHEQANGLAARVAAGVGPMLLGNPARVQPQTQVDPSAPESGTIRIEVVE